MAAWGNNSVTVAAVEARQVPKPDAFDLKCREGLVSFITNSVISTRHT